MIVYHKIFIENNPEFGLTEIPEGYVIHHLDLNHDNNDPKNLVLMKFEQHIILHSMLRQGIKRPNVGKKISESKTKYIEFTDEMLNDAKSGMVRYDFCKKYECSYKTWNRIRQQLIDNNITIEELPRKRCSEEHKQKISDSLKGISKGPFTEEHKRKLSDAAKKRYARMKTI